LDQGELPARVFTHGKRLADARDVAGRCEAVLADARAFMEDAEQRIEEQREVVFACERETVSLGMRFREADEILSAAQRELDIAHADLTDAEVSIIMAEIDARN
jgi:hypothetical protein